MPPDQHSPKQARSQKTVERILKATRELMDGRDFENISVQDVCAASGASRSSFYARFPTKDALLFELHKRHRLWRVEKLAAQTAGIDWPALTIETVIRTCIALYIDDRRSFDPFIRSLTLAEVKHPEISEERARIDSFAVASIRNHLAERLGQDDSEDVQRIDFGIRAVAAIVREAIQPPQHFATRMNLRDDALVDELTGLFCRYTGIRCV